MKITKEKVREFLRESNAIEGVYDEDSLKQAEIAWDYLIKQPVLHLGVVLKTHKILMLNQKGLHPDEKGYLRNIDVWIGGKKALHPILIQEQLEELLQGMLVSIDEEENKADHVEYERIHPFVDGNGRTGRMFMNWHRVKKLKLPLLVIKDSEKQEYYKWFRE